MRFINHKLRKRQNKKIRAIIFIIFIIYIIQISTLSGNISPIYYKTSEDFQQRSIRSAGTSWTLNGISISAGSTDQDNQLMFSDGLGNIFILWRDFGVSPTNGWDIYGQKIDSNGIKQWAANGSAICTANDRQYLSGITSDGAGGMIIVWEQNVDGVIHSSDIFAQRVASNGVVQWDIDGIPICTEPKNQGSAHIISDGNGGAIIVWVDTRSGSYAIYGQRIDSNGIVQWTPNGIPIGKINGHNQFLPQIVSDGIGGAIIVWAGSRDNSLGTDIYAQRINSSGDVKWIANGIAICTAPKNQDNNYIVSDGEGGAIISWIDYRNSATSGIDLYSQKINSTGVTQWTRNGTAICTAIGDQYISDITKDGKGGAIFTWYGSNIFAQSIDSKGDIQWGVNGTPICTAPKAQVQPRIINDGDGGAIITWTDSRGWQQDIYAQSIDYKGDIQWNVNGLPISTALGHQGSSRIISDGVGGIIISWVDSRYSTADIYAQRITPNAIPTSTHPEMIYTSRFDNTTINWILEDDFGGGQYRVWVNNTFGTYYVWQDWQSWINNTPLTIPINRTTPGIFNYTIEFFDVYNLFGISDTVYVSITNMVPTTNYLGMINTSRFDTTTIDWILNDDFGGGQYRVWVNNTFGTYYVWQDWQSWINNTPLTIPINRTTPGIFNYTIEYYDVHNSFGISDTVYVSITNLAPTSNHPEMIETSIKGTEIIDWILNDDFGGSQYRVWANNTFGTYYVWQDWQSWINNTPLTIPINRTTPGIFNYTIEYYDVHNLFGVSDTVIVLIEPSESQIIPFSNYYMIFMAFVILSLILITKRKIRLNY